MLNIQSKKHPGAKVIFTTENAPLILSTIQDEMITMFPLPSDP